MTTYPLHEAAKTGSIGPFNELVKSVEDLEYLDEDHRTPLHIAAIHNEATLGAYLCEIGANPDLQDHEGNTALHLAAKNSSRLFVSMLLWAGTDCEIKNHQGNTALHEAVIANNKDIAWLIVENGGDLSVNILNNEEKSPLDLAKEEKNSENQEMIELLEKAKISI
jgi:uncharacterized protein